MSNSIERYLPEHKETVLVQSKCDRELKSVVEDLMKENTPKLTWRHIIELGMKAFYKHKTGKEWKNK